MSRNQQHILFNFIIVVALCALASGCRSSKSSKVSVYNKGVDHPKIEQHITVDKTRLAKPTVALLNEADSWLGVPYAFGGTTRGGVDCSALVKNVFESSLAIAMPRNSQKQAEFCSPVKRDDLIEGDLVFFTTPNSGDEIGHVGIYTGDGKMVHASSSRGVVVSSIADDYYIRHFKSAGRVEAYYAMIEGKGKRLPTSSPELPDAIMASAAQPQPTITLDQFAKMGSQPQQGEQADLHVAAKAIEAKAIASAATSEPQPIAAVHSTPQKGETSGDDKPSADDARLRVLNAFREQPADSVMSLFFE